MLMRLQIERAGKDIEPELAEDLQDELARLGDYIERTLLSARAEQGKFQPTPRDFDLTERIRDLAEGHALLAAESGRSIHVDAPSSLLVRSDPDAFRHIFDNLLTNAMRHGTGDIGIRVKRHRRSSELMIINRIAHGKATSDPGAGVGLRLVSALARTLPGASYRSHHGARWHAAILRLPAADGETSPVPTRQD
jgi:signal transduction histidine kinase